jgi:hypothetical protein
MLQRELLTVIHSTTQALFPRAAFFRFLGNNFL